MTRPDRDAILPGRNGTTRRIWEDGLRIRPTTCSAAVLATALLLAAAPGHSQTQATADPPVLERSLYKTLVFEGATNAIDLLLFGSLLGGHLYAGPAFLAVNASAAALIYYGHEVAWGCLGPPEDEYDTKTNVLKGTTFRLASSTRAFAVGYGFTGDPIAAGGFMLASAVGETAVYVASEYGWAFYDRMRRPVETAVTRAVLTPAAVIE